MGHPPSTSPVTFYISGYQIHVVIILIWWTSYDLTLFILKVIHKYFIVSWPARSFFFYLILGIKELPGTVFFCMWVWFLCVWSSIISCFLLCVSSSVSSCQNLCHLLTLIFCLIFLCVFLCYFLPLYPLPFANMTS